MKVLSTTNVPLLTILILSLFSESWSMAPTAFVHRATNTVGASNFIQRKTEPSIHNHAYYTWNNHAVHHNNKPLATILRKSRSYSPLKSSISMFAETSGGMEQLQELLDRADTVSPIGKRIRKSPSLFKLAGWASIPVLGILGFAVVPSRRFAAHTVGAIVTAAAGAVGKSRIDALTESTAKTALAQTIVDQGVDSSSNAAAAVRDVKEQYGIMEEDFGPLCTEVYATYLQGMVKYNPIAKTSELKELENLKEALLMNNIQVGEAHYIAAKDWYRATCLFTPEEELDDPDHPDRQALDKLLFLTERALRQQGETDQAFAFELTRTAKALGIPDLSTALDHVAEVAQPFYVRALRSTRQKLGTDLVNADMLAKARHTLGIDDESAFDLHIATFNEEIKEQLGLMTKVPVKEDGLDESSGLIEDENAATKTGDLSTVKLREGAIERLNQLKEILRLSDTDAEYEIKAEVTPLYQSTALAAMNDVLSKTKSPDEAWSIMDQRRVELGLKEESAKSLLSSMVMQALGGPLEETNKFAKVNNEAATYNHLLEALEAKEALVGILTKSGWGEFDNFEEAFCNPWDKQSANGFLSSEERIKMYRMFLTRSVTRGWDSSGRLSDETFNRIKEVQGLLGITDQQAEIESRGAFGKHLSKVLNKAVLEIVEDYTPELVKNMETEVDDVLKSYRLTEDYLREVGVSYYGKAVELISDKSPSGIPTKELATALDSLRNLCKLTIEETYPAHMTYFGSVYKKSILEAMGQTGIIRPEYRDSLNGLQGRLGVSEESSKELFLQAVEEKMEPMVKWIGSELERTLLTQKQLSDRRGKDMGEDVFQTGKGADGVLGLGAEVNIMSDIMELVDFYVENEIIEEEGDVKVFPITALGLGAIDQELAELLYRQFIVGGFQAQGPKAERYEGVREIFAGILGLSEVKIEEVGKTIGNTVYDNFVSNAMKTKGALDQQDMMFLATIQGKLGLTSEQGEKMLLDAQKKILSEEVEVIMDNPTPDAVKEFRDKCNRMGLDLRVDVGLSKQRLSRMFECEIIPGLKSGDISVENSEILGEIQDSIGIDPEECEAMFENVLATLSKNAFGLIKGEILRGREENTVDLIKELVRYAAFTDGELGLEVEEATGYKIVNIYEACDFDGQDYVVIEANKRLLKTAMGIP